jgi:nicotinate-nucleotide adenylyltransferase
MPRPRRIGLLGGTFDPIHLGHLALADAARLALALDEVRLVPAHVPPHRPRPGASVYHRFAMAALAAIETPHLLVDDVEAQDDEPSYTAVTLRRLNAAGLAPSQIFFIAGADAFAEIATWRDYPQVLDHAQFVVVSRSGHQASALAGALPGLAARMRRLAPEGASREGEATVPHIFLIDTEIPAISSTTIRQRAETGQPLDGLVPALVATHIARHALYRGSEGTTGPDGAARELHEQESV